MPTAAMWGVAILAASATGQTTEERLTALEANEVQVLHGAGTTNPSKLFWELLGLMTARARFPVHATYRAVGSSTGQKEFLGASNGNKALNHFGAGDIPMSADRYNAVVAASRTMVHVPFALGGIGVFHSAPVGGASVHLTACVLAKIFSRKITTWDHDDIKALNADVTLPSLPIKVVHRVKGSSSTAGFTAYMLATCPDDWKLGTGSTITWPDGTFEGQGSDGMSTFIEENEGAPQPCTAPRAVTARCAHAASLNPFRDASPPRPHAPPQARSATSTRVTGTSTGCRRWRCATRTACT